MPSAVTAIFGADASPVVAAFNVVTAAAAGSASATAANMRMAIKEIEKLKLAATAAGQGTAIYDASLQKLNADLLANESATKRVVTAQERLARMRAGGALRGTYTMPAPLPGSPDFIGPLPNPKELEEAGKQGASHLARGWRLAGPMFVSAARDTAASLASGAPLTTVFMQQAPQVLQAMQMVGMAGLKAMLAPFIALFASALAIGAIIAAPFIFRARVNAIAKALSGPELPDLDRTYIPSINRAAEAWRKVKEAVEDVVKAFYGATASAERMTAISDRKLAHEGKMAEFERARELSRATSAAQRNAINEKYDAKKLEREFRQEDINTAIQRQRVVALDEESKKAEQQALALKQSNPGKNSRNRADVENRAKAGQELLDKEEKDQVEKANEGWMGASWRYLKREFGAKYKYGLNPYEAAAGMAMEDTEKVKGLDVARGSIAYLNREKDKDAARKVKDEQAEKLSAESVAKAKEAEELKLKLDADAQQQAAKRAERLAEISAERRNANQEAMNANVSDGRGMLTANQRMGAYAPAAAAVSTVGTRQLDVQSRILKAVETIRDKRPNPNSGTAEEVAGFSH